MSALADSSARILIVDDDPTNIKVLNGILRDRYHVLAATRGETALKLVQQHPPDLILLDVMMPEMDGYTVCQHIRSTAAGREIPIIFVTALTDSRHEVYGLTLGAVDYVTKPVQPAVIQARVRTHVELKQHRDRWHAERTLIEQVVTRMRHESRFRPEDSPMVITPVEETTGDMVCAARTPDGIRHILVGDFTGHGLPAAIASPLVTDIFYSMTGKGLSMTEILLEINRKVNAKMPPTTFLAAAAIELIPHATGRTDLAVWNLGLPDLWMLDPHGVCLHTFPSDHLPLGILPDAVMTATRLQGNTGSDTLFIHTDGGIEARDTAGDMFGTQRMLSAVQAVVQHKLPIDTITKQLDAFRGSEAQHDDITMMMIHV
jgi:CheY-like chemotaxis protein